MARLLIHDACLADGRSPELQVGISLLLDGETIAAIGPNEEVDAEGAEILDGGGATIIPSLVDGHSHITLPGGSHWIARGTDPPERLRQVARDNARRLVHAGILFARDVGAPVYAGTHRPLSLDVREELNGKAGQPYIRVAGPWLAKGIGGLTIQVDNGDALLDAANEQLELGTDAVKMILDGPDRSSPFTVDEIRKVRDAAHARGARISAHCSYLDGARVAALANLDAIEHGFELDDDIARTMAAQDVALVSTLSVIASFETFAHTTKLERFTTAESRSRVGNQRASAFAAIAAAKRAGVKIAAGSDSGGGSVRAGHLAWEVELLVKAGLEPWEALAAATWRGGDLLGVPHAGRLSVGGPADFSLVHGDPLSDPSALWRVWAVFQRGSRVA